MRQGADNAMMNGPQTTIVMRCCICGKFLGIRDGCGVSGISHGFCDRCLSEYLKKLEEKGGNQKERK